MGYTINALIYTSVDDCKCSLRFVTDLGFLRQLLAECERREHASRAQVVARRIRQIERAAK